jgi:hypothetical protein
LKWEDSVKSYFGMRKIGRKGFRRIQSSVSEQRAGDSIGPLDQGWWGWLYTAPTDEALKSDIVR